MLYAICENGGMVNENVRWERFETKSEALKTARTLQEIEDTLAEDDLNRTYFDVVGVYTDEDGDEVITTEI